MNKAKLLQKLARLAVEVGVNIQKGQILSVNAPVDAAPFIRMVVKAAYEAGAGKVIVNYYDDIIQKELYQHATEELLIDVPEYNIERLRYIVDKGAAVLSITSQDPEILKDVDSTRVMRLNKATGPKTKFYQEHMMASQAQWSIVAYPNVAWAKTVFPALEDHEAYDRLLDAILKTSRVNEQDDPISAWQNHVKCLENHNQMLNKYRFKQLVFRNALGTDLVVDLVEDHIWAGGGEMSAQGVYFVPNIPTEETFTMPHKYGVNGKVCSTKPLSYQGKLIQDFYLVFKDGKVVEYDAKTGKDALKGLLELDEGSSHLGEVALISFDSPISNLNILFNNTLFDENASCHLALGNAYAMNIKNGTTMSKEALFAKGYNESMAHVDFMFGSSDMEIDGITQEGNQVPVFRKGNFVF